MYVLIAFDFFTIRFVRVLPFGVEQDGGRGRGAGDGGGRSRDVFVCHFPPFEGARSFFTGQFI